MKKLSMNHEHYGTREIWNIYKRFLTQYLYPDHVWKMYIYAVKIPFQYLEKLDSTSSNILLHGCQLLIMNKNTTGI
jgi:hypothetical protein